MYHSVRRDTRLYPPDPLAAAAVQSRRYNTYLTEWLPFQQRVWSALLRTPVRRRRSPKA